MMKHITEEMILSFPENLILGCETPVQRLRAVFGVNSEFLISKIIAAFGVRFRSEIELRQMVGKLTQAFLREPGTHLPQFLDHLVTLEQMALSIRDVLDREKAYLLNFLPYRYETTLLDGGLVLKRMHDFDDFMDEYSVQLQEYEDLQDRW